MAVFRRWDPCVYHHGAGAETFIAEYFGQPDRRVIVITGVGFDPRTGIILDALVQAANDRVQGIFIREMRSSGLSSFAARAAQNLRKLINFTSDYHLLEIAVFAADGALIGDRTVTSEVNALLDGCVATDVVVDMSSLSLGSFSA